MRYINRLFTYFYLLTYLLRNTIQTVCMIFKPKNLDGRISADFPCFTLDSTYCKLKFVLILFLSYRPM